VFALLIIGVKGWWVSRIIRIIRIQGFEGSRVPNGRGSDFKSHTI
jgi:hypothetical protein